MQAPFVASRFKERAKLGRSDLWQRAFNHAPVLLPYVALFVLLRAWFKPGLIAGEDFHPLDWSGKAMLLHHYLPWPGSWNASVDLGLPTEFWMPMHPLFFIGGLLSSIGASWEVIERVLFLMPLFVLLVLAPYLLTFRLTRSPWAASAGALVFAINTWVVGLIERGHIPALVGYSLMPLALLFAGSAIRSRSRRDTFCFALVVLIQGTYEIRYAYLTIIAAGALAAVEILARPRSRLTIATLRLMVLALAIVIAGSLYWVLPMVLSPVSLPAGYGGLREFIGTNAKMSLLGSFSLFYPFYHHIPSNNGFHHDPVEWPFIIVGLLVALGLVAGRNRPSVRALTLLWVAGVVFASGSLGIFGALDQWIFLHVPGMSAFRDSTKLYAYSNLAAAGAIAVLLVRIAHFPRLRMAVSPATTTIVAAALFAAFYLFGIRDAYNPLRLSNFAVVRVGAADTQLQHYLDRAPAGKVLYFPSYPYGYVNNGLHAAVEAGYLAQPNWSLMGLGALSSDPGNMLSFYGSPLTGPLMCETGIRYVVIDTDPEGMYYEPWQYPLQRGEAIKFFDERPWLERVDFGARHFPLGERPLLYRVTGCDSNPARLAFTTRLPVIFNGSDRYVQALAGTPFWRKDPVVLLATQQRNLTPYDSVQNVISAPLKISRRDLDAADYALPVEKERALLTEASRRVRFDPWMYHGYAFSAQAQAAEVGAPFPPGFIKGAFESTTGQARISAVVTPRYAKSQIAAVVRGAIPAPARRPAPLLIDPWAFDVQQIDGARGVSGAGYSGWLQVSQGGAHFAIVNPLPRPVVADIAFPGATTLAGVDQVYTVSIAGVHAWSVALPSVLHDLFHAATSLTVHAVKLEPGSNAISITPANVGVDSVAPSPLLIDANILVVDPRVVPGDVETLPLHVATSQTSGGGVRMSVESFTNAIAAGAAHYTVLRSTNIPLTKRPLLTFRYLAPGAPINFEVLLGLRGPNGSRQFIADLPRGLHEFNLDPFLAVQRALDDRRAQTRLLHQGDFAWLRADAHRPREEASQYAISYVDLLVAKPALTDAGSVSGTFDSMEVSLPETSVSTPAIDFVDEYDFSSAKALANVRQQNVSLLQVVKTPQSVSIVASLHRMAQEAIPTQIRAGDKAEVTLTTGTTIYGVVKSVSPEFIVFQNGDKYTGVRRSTIAEIRRLFPKVQQYFSVDVPFDVPKDATNIRFRLFTDSDLKPEIHLLVRPTAGARIIEIFPQDRLASAAPEAQIPSSWIQLRPDVGRLDALEALYPLPQTPRGPVPQEAAYDIPINAVFASELPNDANPRIVGLRFAFHANTSDTSGAVTSTARLSDLAATSGASSELPWRNVAFVTIDAKRIALAPRASVNVENGEGTRNTGTVFLSAGMHQVLAREGGGADIRSVLISQGHPVVSVASDVASENLASYSERIGSIDTPGGLLVMPTTFAPRWHLALVSSSFRLSGNPLKDYFALRTSFVSPEKHVMVNGGLNAWFVPRFHGRVVFIYDGTVYSRIAVVIELIVIAVWGLVFWLRRSKVNA